MTLRKKNMSEIEIRFLETRAPFSAAYDEIVHAVLEVERKREVVSLFAPAENSGFLCAAQERYDTAVEKLHTACVAYEILRTQVSNFYIENREALLDIYPNYKTPSALDVVERALINH